MSETERLYEKNAGTGAVAYDEGLRRYMLGVYNLMAMGVAATALIAFFFVTNTAALRFAMGLQFLPFIGVIGLGWFAPRLIFSGSRTTAQVAYWAYVGLWGLLIGPFVAGFFGSPELALLPAQAFFISASIFAALSLYGYTTKKDLSPWGKFLFMAGIGFLVLIVVNWLFIQSSMMSLLVSGGIILFISAVTAYETQMIKNLYVQGGGEQNERAAIFGAFALYGSFVTLFIHVLNILGIMRE